MSESICPGCVQRDALIVTLRQRVADLERQVQDLQQRLGINASNSSIPPSANPPAAPPPVVKRPTGRKSGGQPGHKGHQRVRLPAQRVRHVIPLIPSHCEACHAALPQQPSATDPDPVWHQFAELPKVQAVITEFQGHARTCLCCGHVTRESIPAEIRAHAFGPRLAAVMSYLSGTQYVSQRGLEDVCEVVFGVPLSLGSVTVLQEQMSQALEPAHQQIAEEVRPAEVKNVDETGWKQAGDKRWLWAAVTATAALFVIHLKRGVVGLKALLGEAVQGLVCSDRWSAYLSIPVGRRQLCWAHLKRDFQAMVDRGGVAAKLGEELLEYTEMLFDLWYKVRDGTRSRRWLKRQIDDWLRAEVKGLLQRGAACSCAKTAGVCGEILKLEPALWTFAAHVGLEPTNNAAERALRPAVIKRKRSFGCHSEAGCRFVERLFSVTATLRLRQQPVLDYLVEALVAHRHGLPAPKLPVALEA
jgi:transposase